MKPKSTTPLRVLLVASPKTILMAVAIFFSSIATTWAQTNAAWELVRETNGVAEYVRSVTGKPFKEAKITTTYEASIDSVVKLLRNPAQYPFWMDSTFSHWQILKDNGNGSWYVYAQMETPMFMRDRDAIFLVTVKRLPTGCFVLIEGAPTYTPEDAHYIRLQEFNAKVVVRSTDAEHVDIAMTKYTDFGGNMPTSIVNAHTTEIVAHMISSMKRITEQPNTTAISSAK